MSNADTVRILAEVLQGAIKERDEARAEVSRLISETMELRVQLALQPSRAPDLTPSPAVHLSGEVQAAMHSALRASVKVVPAPSPAVTGRPFYPKTEPGEDK